MDHLQGIDSHPAPRKIDAEGASPGFQSHVRYSIFKEREKISPFPSGKGGRGI